MEQKNDVSSLHHSLCQRTASKPPPSPTPCPARGNSAVPFWYLLPTNINSVTLQLAGRGDSCRLPHHIDQGLRDFSGSCHSHCRWLKWPRGTGRRGRFSHTGRLCAPPGMILCMRENAQTLAGDLPRRRVLGTTITAVLNCLVCAQGNKLKKPFTNSVNSLDGNWGGTTSAKPSSDSRLPPSACALLQISVT